MFSGIRNRIQFFGLACLVILFTGIFTVSVNAHTNVKTVHASVPLISIDEVVRNESVTISGSHFPANQAFTVRMGAFGSRGINGALSLTTVNSGDGEFTAEIAIPAGVKDFSRIAIRLDHGIYNSYNWFYNNSTDGSAVAVTDENKEDVGKPDTDTNVLPVYTGVPSLTFEKVEGEQVTVRTGNFPPNQTFFVSMGSHGSAGRGPSVGSIVSGDGADKSQTFTIPASIAHYGYILVRAQTGHANPFYATAAFNNPLEVAAVEAKKDTEQAKPPVAPDPDPVQWLGNPTLTACAVDAGKTVTVVAKNLPTNLEYTIRMDNYGAAAVNGIEVGKLNPGNDATVEKTFKIPAGLANNGVIAIRAEAGVYHAFEFFYNTTATVC